jgi:hypothetical protein
MRRTAKTGPDPNCLRTHEGGEHVSMVARLELVPSLASRLTSHLSRIWSLLTRICLACIRNGTSRPLGRGLPTRVGKVAMSLFAMIVAANERWLRGLKARPEAFQLRTEGRHSPLIILS